MRQIFLNMSINYAYKHSAHFFILSVACTSTVEWPHKTVCEILQQKCYWAPAVALRIVHNSRLALEPILFYPGFKKSVSKTIYDIFMCNLKFRSKRQSSD